MGLTLVPSMMLYWKQSVKSFYLQVSFPPTFLPYNPSSLRPGTTYLKNLSSVQSQWSAKFHRYVELSMSLSLDLHTDRAWQHCTSHWETRQQLGQILLFSWMSWYLYLHPWGRNPSPDKQHSSHFSWWKRMVWQEAAFLQIQSIYFMRWLFTTCGSYTVVFASIPVASTAVQGSCILLVTWAC